MRLHCFENLLIQIVLLHQLPERKDRGLIRDPVADQSDAGKATHDGYLDQRILHRWIAEVIPLLQEMNPKQYLQWVGRPAGFAACLGVEQLNQIEQLFQRHNLLHLREMALPLGALFGRELLVITDTGLLAAHVPFRDCDYPGIIARLDSVFQSIHNTSDCLLYLKHKKHEIKGLNYSSEMLACQSLKSVTIDQ